MLFFFLFLCWFSRRHWIYNWYLKNFKTGLWVRRCMLKTDCFNALLEQCGSSSSIANSICWRLLIHCVQTRITYAACDITVLFMLRWVYLYLMRVMSVCFRVDRNWFVLDCVMQQQQHQHHLHCFVYYYFARDFVQQIRYRICLLFYHLICWSNSKWIYYSDSVLK